jgi:hypothetical protein
LASPTNPANRRRSERVMLQMKVTVIADDVQHKPRQEEAMTLVVNAHGGLLNLHMEVLPAQPVVIVNLKSGREQSAKIVRVEHPPGGHTQVAFEFNTPSPDFWPIIFPPADWGLPS